MNATALCVYCKKNNSCTRYWKTNDKKCPYFNHKTNADNIRSMNDEELAEFLTHINPTNCKDCAFSHGWRCQPDRNDYSDFEKCKEGRKRWLQQLMEVSE